MMFGLWWKNLSIWITKDFIISGVDPANLYLITKRYFYPREKKPYFILWNRCRYVSALKYFQMKGEQIRLYLLFDRIRIQSRPSLNGRICIWSKMDQIPHVVADSFDRPVEAWAAGPICAVSVHNCLITAVCFQRSGLPMFMLAVRPCCPVLAILSLTSYSIMLWLSCHNCTGGSGISVRAVRAIAALITAFLTVLSWQSATAVL